MPLALSEIKSWSDLDAHPLGPEPAAAPGADLVRLRMTYTIPGSVRPLAPVVEYQAGEVYELPDDAGGLAEVFLREGWAERVVEAAPVLAEVEVAPEVVAPVKRARRK